MRYIVVTDLDGTLLDHQTYEFTPALKAIAELKRRNIPLVLNSSKTQTEILEIRQQLNNHQPFICENGGIICGIGEPQYLGTPRTQFLEDLKQIEQKLQLNYLGFAQAMVDDVVRWTGLHEQDARKAMERNATEPLLWQDTDSALNNFRRELAKIQLQCIKGGRFYHVMGMFDKASCFTKLKHYYSQLWQEEVGIIALGDSPNDLPMLEQADYAVVIPSAKGDKLQPKQSAMYFATQQAPRGWQEGIDWVVNSVINR